jgi:hypothetical protein
VYLFYQPSGLLMPSKMPTSAYFLLLLILKTFFWYIFPSL